MNATTGFGIRLREARNTNNLSQYDVADLVGMSQWSVCQWEKGAVPSPNMIKKLADCLDVDAKWLLTGEEKKADTPQVTMCEEPKKKEPKTTDKTFLVYRAEDGRRLDNINLCIRHIREMDITKEQKIQIHKTLTYFRDSIERTVLFGE